MRIDTPPSFLSRSRERFAAHITWRAPQRRPATTVHPDRRADAAATPTPIHVRRAAVVESRTYKLAMIDVKLHIRGRLLHASTRRRSWGQTILQMGSPTASRFCRSG